MRRDIQSAYETVCRYTEGRNLCAYVLTFGCQQNEADSEKLRGMALKMGYSLTDAPEKADLILVNTCAIRQHAELKALSIIGSFKHLKKEKPSLVIGVTGCMTAQEHRVQDIKMRYHYVDFTLEPSSLHLLPLALADVLSSKKRRFLREDCSTEAIEGIPLSRTCRHRAWVSIMYGCNNFCSYCIVPYVRLRERSRSAADIEEEVRTLVSEGCLDITLLGQNVNSYKGECNFAELLRRLDRIDGDFQLRFMTSHPKDVSEELIHVMAEGKHIAPHLHLPLQSGSDRILKAMNRHYDIARYMQTVNHFRATCPDFALTTDIIVGFPTETEEDFEATLDILRRVRFDLVYAFLYSARKGTPAAEMKEQIEESVKKERFARLLALQDEISLERAKAYENKTLRVLVDSKLEKSDGTLYAGRTDSGKLVHLVGDDSMIGKYCQSHIDRAEAFILHGTALKK